MLSRTKLYKREKLFKIKKYLLHYLEILFHLLKFMDIEKLRTFYPRLEAAVSKLNTTQLNTPIREGAWSPAQFLHHLADAQAQAFYRCVWILAEENTTLKPFDQNAWVDLMGKFPIQPAMDMLKGLYSRWFSLLDSLQESQFETTGQHPELGPMSITDIVEYYIDHGEGHILQFTKFSKV